MLYYDSYILAWIYFGRATKINISFYHKLQETPLKLRTSILHSLQLARIEKLEGQNLGIKNQQLNLSSLIGCLLIILAKQLPILAQTLIILIVNPSLLQLFDKIRFKHFNSIITIPNSMNLSAS